jgi:4-amino-4-deoxy-L-arabinose transferase-like glycosyltransferase
MAKPESKSLFSKENINWLLFAAVICVIYFFALGSIPLIGPDEPRYAQVAREMFERGDWVTPTLGGWHWFEKPALLYWLQIASYKAFGVSEFSARLGPALCGLLTVVSLYLFGRAKTFKDSPVFGNWLGLISASTIGLLVFSRGASFDIILTFTVTAALVCFFLADEQADESSIELFSGFYFFVGLSLLAKGLIGIVLPFGVIGSYFLLTRKFFPRKFLISLSWGIPITLVTAAIWYAPVYLRNGKPFVDEFIINHHFSRYLSTVHAHPQPFYFFWLVLPALTFPWLPFLLSAVVRIRQWNFWKPETPFDRVRLFALAWILFPLLFFSASGSKLPGYILPAVAGCCVLIADIVIKFIGANKIRAALLKGVAAAVFAAVIIALQFYVEDAVKPDTIKYLLADADARGYNKAQVINLHDTFHSAEFYAAGRLIRNIDNGKQKKFEGVGDIFRAWQDPRSVGPAGVDKQVTLPALVLVPGAHIKELTDNPWFNATILGDNGEFLLVALDSVKK